eukprot:augustus_masked-scaffold_12-processed-gene-4.2-mRNA-1 protein AED:0.04 eAED:0.04 QI:0/-1/0/1/-1/1/1/0/243
MSTEPKVVQLDDSKITVDDELLSSLVTFQNVINSKIKTTSTPPQTKDTTLETAVTTIPKKWADNLLNIAFTEQEILNKVKQLATEISKEYAGKEIVVVGLLTGAVCFMADLIKYLKVPYTIDFISCSSYGKGTVSKGSPVLLKDMGIDPKNKHILLVEDIIDTGRTLAWLKKYLSGKECASVKVACLLDKKARRLEKHVYLDFSGFECPNEFVVGYGMDFAGEYRGMPFIGVLKPEAYQTSEE